MGPHIIHKLVFKKVFFFVPLMETCAKYCYYYLSEYLAQVFGCDWYKLNGPESRAT